MKLSLSELTYNLGHVLQQQGNLAAAGAAYQRAVELSPSFVQARHALAIVLGEQGQYQAAIDHYAQVIAQQPDAVRVYNNLACILALQGQRKQAIQMYQQAIERQPGWAVPYDNLGKILEAQDPAAAAVAYRQAIALDANLLSARYGLGCLMQRQGQVTAAIDCLSQLLVLDPEHSASHAAMGSAYLTLGEFEQALQHFRQALWPQQAQIQAFCDWVVQLQPIDELTLARQACGRFLQALLQSNHPDIQASVTESLQQSLQPRVIGNGTTNSAAQVMQKPQLGLQLAQTYSKLGDLLMRYGGDSQLRQAEVYYQQALQLQPQIEFYLTLGSCLMQQNRSNAALMLYRLVLAIAPDARLYRSLGEILEQQQHWSEAILCYQKALQTDGLGRPAEPIPNHRTTDSLVSPVSFKAALPTRQWCQQQSCFYTSIHINPDPQSLTPGIPQATPLMAEPGLDRAHPCEGLNCQPCLQKLNNRFELRHLGLGLYRAQASNLAIATPPYFVAEIPQGQAWITPYQTPWMVANSTGVLTTDQILLRDLCREYPGQLPDCPHRPLPLRLPQTYATAVAGTVAVLTGLSGHNYFHWMVDVLPRLELLRRSHRFSEIDWFWINHPQAEFQQTTLRCLGIPAHQILAADLHPFIQAEHLIAPSFPGHLGWVEPWALEFLRQQFLPLVSPKSPSYERIYITRRNAHHRRLLNEPAVLELLEPLGFRTVELESLALTEQISLFAQAKIILAPHGGGLTNTIFCAPETVVIEFVAPSYIRHYYWAISHHLGLHHYFVTGVTSTCPPIHQLMYPSPLVEDIWLDLAALKNTLKQINLI